MSGECDKCGEDALDCRCKKIQVGYEAITIDKLFGPQIFANLRIFADPQTNTWVIERERIDTMEWIEWVRIPGQLSLEFREDEDEQ